MRWLFSVVAVVVVASVSGCKKDSSGSAQSGDTNRQVFQVKGVIKSIKPNGKTAEIAHEEIPGYMVAMTMDFEVKNTNDLKGLKAGDRVAFDMVVTKDDGWIERVRKLAPEDKGKQPAEIVVNTGDTNSTNAGPRKFRKSPIVEPLAVGDQVPDYKFTNHLGQPISLAQFRGRALAVTFIFTRCPFPTFCPRMNQNFAGVQERMKSPGNPTNWTLLSISFDPEYDTPERLANYAKQYSPDINHWQFATGDFWNLDGLTEQLMLQFWKQDNTINHNLRTTIFDTHGRLTTNFIGNEWKAEEFADELKKAAQIK
jgi:protein SCO1